MPELFQGNGLSLRLLEALAFGHEGMKARSKRCMNLAPWLIHETFPGPDSVASREPRR